ncbi:MAG TPA: DUF2207 domain-containing protein [Homoserinimonas sp.]|nr:DUF2207 domain-containing protein [Homoserinimonas sp.]
MKRILSLLMIIGGLVLGVAAPASAGVDDFFFDSFDGQYELSRDAEGRSVLTTTETLVAVFPDFDQNRGIRRLLVDDYDGHPTDIELQSVTDEAGNPRHYETETDDGFLELTIADDGVYVHGEQTYVITYTQRNVTKYFSDTDADEFYWDTNGTGWSQPFGEVTATVTLDADLMAAHNGNVAAVAGRAGENAEASVATTGSGYTFTATDLGAGENLTFAIGFEPGTFEPRDSGFFAAPWPSLALFFALAGILVSVAAGFTRARKLQDAPGRGIIVPEYLAPKNANVFLSSVIVKKQAKATTAAILKLAVAGNIRVLEVPGRKPHYQLQFITADGTDDDEREFLHALFGSTLDPDELRSLQKADQKAATRIGKLMKRVTSDATANGFRRKIPAGLVGLLVALAAVSTAVAFLAAVVSLDQAYGGAWPVLFILLAVATVITTIILVAKIPLTESGVELRDYLRGLEMYMELAEADRIRYLQSPQGAVTTPVATDTTTEVVKLNEKLLPYAVMFGHEKEWAAELGRYYEELGDQPHWYAGQGAFNAALFSSSIGAMAASTASAYSSSSGGSGGGASSGGGGGGGGGGGV